MFFGDVGFVAFVDEDLVPGLVAVGLGAVGVVPFVGGHADGVVGDDDASVFVAGVEDGVAFVEFAFE